MAIKTITLGKKMERNVLSEAITFTAATAVADGFSIPFGDQDAKIVILVRNDGSAAGTLTVKHGDSIMGAADTEGFSVGASELRAIVLDSMAFKNVNGSNKGNVVAIPSTADLKIAAIVLP